LSAIPNRRSFMGTQLLARPEPPLRVVSGSYLSSLRGAGENATSGQSGRIAARCRLSYRKQIALPSWRNSSCDACGHGGRFRCHTARLLSFPGFAVKARELLCFALWLS
jgi:hypothetical protein